MTCDEVQDNLTAYCDGELSLETAAFVRHHITGCAACSKMLEELQSGTSLLRDMFSTIAASPSVETSVMSRIRDLTQAHHSFRMAVASIWSSVLVVAFFLVAVLSPAGTFIWAVLRVVFKLFASAYSLLSAAVIGQCWMVAGIVVVIGFLLAAWAIVAMRQLIGNEPI